MADFNTKSIDLSGLEQKLSEGNLTKASEAFTESVAFRMRKNVPEDEGTLRDSEPLASNYSEGQIIWNTPYAKDVYNRDSVGIIKNPLARPHWAEYTKANEIDGIKQDAAAIIGNLLR